MPYYDDEFLYIYSEKGKLLKKIPIYQSSIYVGDKYFSYLSKNKINIYSFINNKNISINLNSGEKITDKEGKTIEPNKGAIVISDTNNNSIKIVNYNKKTIKIIKNSTVESVNFDKENNKSLLITKQGKNYNLYVIK